MLEPDNDVQAYMNFKFGLYAHESYVAAHGFHKSADDTQVRLLGDNEFSGSPLLRGNTTMSRRHASRSSEMGIGFYPEIFRLNRTDLIAVIPLQPDRLVTRRELQWSSKVQALLKLIKENRLPV